jgi:hypothetical protein
MVNVTAVSFVGDAPRKPVYYANPAFRLAQEKQAGIRRYYAAIEISRHFFTTHTWKLKLQLLIFYQAASLVLVKNYTTTITSKEAALLCVCQVFMQYL